MANELLESTPVQQSIELDTDQPSARPSRSLVGLLKNWRKGWGDRWSLLQSNQIIYVIALVLFFTVDGDIETPSSGLWFVGILALFAMSRELWAIFVKVWESTLGRLVLLVTYAAIANFTLAIAAQKINEVIGVDPTYLYHTQGLTVLLILPLWIMMVSVVAMVISFGFLQVLKLISGIFVLLRIIAKDAKPKEAFPKTFIIVRLILLVPVTMTLSHSLTWYAEQLNLPQSSGFNFNSTYIDVNNDEGAQIANAGLSIIDAQLNDPSLTPAQQGDLKEARAQIIGNLVEKGIVDAAELPINGEDLKADQNQHAEDAVISQQIQAAELEESVDEPVPEPRDYFFDKLIAAFVYNYEAFQHSHCIKASNERVVYISDDQVLVASKDASTQIGYVFSAKDCVTTSLSGTDGGNEQDSASASGS